MCSLRCLQAVFADGCSLAGTMFADDSRLREKGCGENLTRDKCKSISSDDAALQQQASIDHTMEMQNEINY